MVVNFKYNIGDIVESEYFEYLQGPIINAGTDGKSNYYHVDFGNSEPDCIEEGNIKLRIEKGAEFSQ